MSYFAETYLDKNKSLSIIDIGSYDINGAYKPIFNKPNWEYTGMDIVPGSNVDIVGFENIKKQYDVLISGQCMEHVRRPWEWLKNNMNYVVPGGFICIIVPYSQDEHKCPLDTYRYLPDGMRDLFEYAGIEVIEIFKSDNNSPLVIKDTIGIGKKVNS
jgi:hypothetical protein